MCSIINENRKKRRTYADKKWLQVLRIRYVWRCRQQIMLDRTGQILRFCAKQMIIHEVRRDVSMNNACYAILRQIWRFDKKSGLSWHDWTRKNGWTCFPWGLRKIV